MHGNDVVITGPHRSGTTLVCELLNLVPDAVALDEPMDEGPWRGRAARQRGSLLRRRIRRALPDPIRRRLPVSHPWELDPKVFLTSVDGFFADTRRSILSTKRAYSKSVGGKVTGAKFLDDSDASGIRTQITEVGMITIDKALSPDFLLAVKHNTGFTAVLEYLVQQFRSYAVIRNPLSMLASWQTVPIPARNGRIPRAEQVDPKLRATLEATSDVLERQLFILDWCFDHYDRFLPRERVIKYEDIVATRGRALSVIWPAADALDEPLASRNKASVYDPDWMREAGARLLARDGNWWKYYERSEVERLLDA
jgi:hypothetical protein